MYANLGRTVRFIATAALVGANAGFFAVEHGFDDIVDAAQIRGLDLYDMTGLVVGEVCKS